MVVVRSWDGGDTSGPGDLYSPCQLNTWWDYTARAIKPWLGVLLF